jgi:hypothetical protein
MPQDWNYGNRKLAVLNSLASPGSRRVYVAWIFDTQPRALQPQPLVIVQFDRMIVSGIADASLGIF